MIDWTDWSLKIFRSLEFTKLLLALQIDAEVAF